MVVGVICAIATFAQPGVAGAPEPPAGSLSEGPITGMAFAWILSGSFSMGDSTIVEMEWKTAFPVHTVTVAGFEMMTTEVTQGVWMEVMGTNPSFFTGDPRLPLESVSWFACQAFVDSLNAIDPSHSYRLPSEAEWEYACRAGTEGAFYWGDTMDYDYCLYLDCTGDSTNVVGQKIPNAWGLYDMSGNVEEWCLDVYHWDGYSGAPVDGSPWIEGDAATDGRVLRGGSWLSCDIEEYAVYDCRSGARGGTWPDSYDFTYGLRVARSDR